MLNSKKMYETGEYLVKSGNLVDAIPYFNVSKGDREYRFESLSKLFNLYIRLSDYSKCRKLLEEMQDFTKGRDCDGSKVRYFEAQLDMIELNVNSSLDKYRSNFNTGIDGSFYPAFYGIADIYSFFGFNDVARNMYETILMNKDYYASTAYRIFNLDLLEHDFLHADRILSDDLMKTDMKKYLHCKVIVDYYLGRDISYAERIYVGDILKDETLKTALTHIQKHKSLSNRDLSCFNDDINLLSLLKEVKERIKTINPTSLAMADYYRFNTGKVIGTFEGKPTQDINITTIAGTDKIITMFPIRLSDEFNKEGLLENEELKSRRRVI